jgi:hypothetical protein
VMVHCILRREVGALGLGVTCVPRGGLVPITWPALLGIAPFGG